MIDVEPHGDERGFLARMFCEHEFAEQGLRMRFVQSSTIHSPQRHTLRGLHFQEAPHAEIKLVRCTRGAVCLVMVDLRQDSPTRHQWLGVELTAREPAVALRARGLRPGLPDARGRQRGRSTRCPTSYVPEAARGVRWDDPALGDRVAGAAAPDLRARPRLARPAEGLRRPGR